MPRSKTLNEQMRAQSQAQIVAAARKLFAERGYFNCKVSDIAREAGMSTGNLYWYYAGKEAVLKAVLADGFEAHEAVLREAATHPGSAHEKLSRLIDRYQDFCRAYHEFFAIFIPILGRGGVPLLKQLGFDTQEIGARYHQHLSRILIQGQDEGVVMDVEPNLLAAFFFSLFTGMMLTYGEDWHAFPTDQIHAAASRLLGLDGGAKTGD